MTRILPFAVSLFLLAACSADEHKKPAMETRNQAPEEPVEKVTKTDAEWRKLLNPEQYRILREAGTEAPHGQVYKEFKKQGEGSYHCAGCGALLFTSKEKFDSGCGALLFTSKEKFDSGCGWPSFYDPAKAQNVKTRKDLTLGMMRVEVLCAKCGGHLGHVFEGEGFNTPTDKRYCINGVGLVFVPAGEKMPEQPVKTPTPQ